MLKENKPEKAHTHNSVIHYHTIWDSGLLPFFFDNQSNKLLFQENLKKNKDLLVMWNFQVHCSQRKWWFCSWSLQDCLSVRHSTQGQTKIGLFYKVLLTNHIRMQHQLYLLLTASFNIPCQTGSCSQLLWWKLPNFLMHKITFLINIANFRQIFQQVFKSSEQWHSTRTDYRAKVLYWLKISTFGTVTWKVYTIVYKVYTSWGTGDVLGHLLSTIPC